MTIVKRPGRTFSFADWTKAHPRDPIPGDRLDIQFQSLMEAIASTQDALADLRRDDGGLANASVDNEQLVPTLRQSILQDITDHIEPIQRSVQGTAASALASEQNAQSYAEDAERAVARATGVMASLASFNAVVENNLNAISKNTAALRNSAMQLDNAANWATAQSDNAEKFKNEALQWAEYLAGPVVNPNDAPAYIAGTPFPHGLYYQPVEGGLAGLWSSKWWALFAQQLVGKWGFYYLGAQTSPPTPGGANPNTGQPYPNPIAVGSIYFDIPSNQMFVWNGAAWQPVAMSIAPGYQAQYLYIATAGQTAFSGPDYYGNTPDVGTAPSDVHVNGLRLPPYSYTVDATANTLTLGGPASASDVVQWDLLAGAVTTGGTTDTTVLLPVKIDTLTPDGTSTDFALTYFDETAGAGTPTTVGSNPELMVSLDGIVQEPGVDFIAYGSTLSMTTAPAADSKLWAIWFRTGTAAVGPPLGIPVDITAPVISGTPQSGQTLTSTAGSWTNSPTSYIYEWFADGVIIGVSIPVSTTAPVISGTAQSGQTLTSTPGSWTNSPTSYAYEWFADGAVISAVPVDITAPVISGTAQSGQTLTAASGSWTNSPTSYVYEWLADGVLIPDIPSNTSSPVISGTAQSGQTLNASTGTWTQSPTGYVYQWQANGVDLP